MTNTRQILKKLRKQKNKRIEKWIFTVNVYFLKEQGLNEVKVKITKTVPKNQLQQVLKDIQDFGTEILKAIFTNFCKRFTIIWKKNKVCVKFKSKVKKILDKIVNLYHEDAMSRYLEKNTTTIYSDYEFVFDDFKITNTRRKFKEKNYWI